ncbi:DNA-3-methyladenine glycosylase [Metabacillus idriensis]|uniref:DNA-3-methyladenine glycosylase n=1 Tax=Metabacillus idriensis TaxID=324768 RepID=UPI001748BDD2|nr:DNA-3-methyladenine glycosylase [Metabacillus idriensis]
MNIRPVSPIFFSKPTIELAQALLGMLLVKETDEGLAAGIIVETEAYIGPGDQAAHSFNNRRTARTEIMFGKAGYTYTYVMHTHCLVNVVSGEVNSPEAILIRSVEPVIGQELMYQRRGQVKKVQDLTNGPGKLTKALGIVKEDYGLPLWESPLFISEGEAPEMISAGPRIGIDNSGDAKEYPWRFWVSGNRFVSGTKKNNLM